MVVESGFGVGTGSAGREMNREDASLPLGARNGQRAAMSLCDVFHNGESKPGSTELAASGLVHAVEPLEKTRQVLFRNPAALILNAYADVIIFLCGTHLDQTARFTEVDCIVQQVDHSLCEKRHVDWRQEARVAQQTDADVFHYSLGPADLDGGFEHIQDSSLLEAYGVLLAVLLDSG